MSSLTDDALKSWAANASPEQIREWVKMLTDVLADRAQADLQEYLTKHDLTGPELMTMMQGRWGQGGWGKSEMEKHLEAQKRQVELQRQQLQNIASSQGLGVGGLGAAAANLGANHFGGKK